MGGMNHSQMSNGWFIIVLTTLLTIMNPPATVSWFFRSAALGVVAGTDLLPSQHSDQGYTIHGAIRHELQDGKLSCGETLWVKLILHFVLCNIHK
jgi:hypothetical protein